jgi:hypothetical protein
MLFILWKLFIYIYIYLYIYIYIQHKIWEEKKLGTPPPLKTLWRFKIEYLVLIEIKVPLLCFGITSFEDDHITLASGRSPQYFGNWKTTSISWQMEDNFKNVVNRRRPQFCLDGKRPQFVLSLFCKWKTTSMFVQWKTTSIVL